MNASISAHSGNGTSSLNTYFKEIARYPLLKRPQEEELVQQMLQGSEAARETLINANLRLVVSQAQKFKGLGLSLEDLIAEGNIGLIRSIERFQPGLGAGVCTYAVWWIRQRIIRAIENHGRTVRLPVHVLARIRKIRTATADLTQLLGREPEDWEIAEHLGMTSERLAGLRESSAAVTSLDEILDEENQPLVAPALNGVSGAADPFDTACQGCDREQVNRLLVTLPDRLRVIIERRFGIGSGARLTLHELGRELDVTRERTRQLERKALAMLRMAAFRMDPDGNASLLNQLETALPRRSRRRQAAA